MELPLLRFLLVCCCFFLVCCGDFGSSSSYVLPYSHFQPGRRHSKKITSFVTRTTDSTLSRVYLLVEKRGRLCCYLARREEAEGGRFSWSILYIFVVFVVETIYCVCMCVCKERTRALRVFLFFSAFTRWSFYCFS